MSRVEKINNASFVPKKFEEDVIKMKKNMRKEKSKNANLKNAV